jgi:hypothetical protein
MGCIGYVLGLFTWRCWTDEDGWTLACKWEGTMQSRVALELYLTLILLQQQ